MESKKLIVAMLACLMISSGTRAQQPYIWQITHQAIVPIPGTPDSYQYGFNWIDSYGEVCTASGQISGTAVTGNHLMFFRSTDGGKTWADQDPDLPSERGTNQNEIFRVQQIDSLNAVGIGYIADSLEGSTDDTGFVVRTFNGGLTWQRQDIHTNEIVGGVHFSDPLTGIIILNRPTTPGNSDACDIETTHDGGVTWTLASFSPWSFGANCHSDGGDSFRVVSYEWGTVYSTTDSWNTIDSTHEAAPFTDSSTPHVLVGFNFKGIDTIIGYGATGTFPQRLFLDRSTNGGMSWDSEIYTGSAVSSFAMSSLDRGVIFLAINQGLDNPYLGESTDHGSTWNIVPMSLDTFVGFGTNCVTVTEQNEAIVIISADGHGFLIRGVPGTDDISVPAMGTQSISVYPNPFTQSTEITFFTPAGYAEISIHNALGTEVARLFAGELEAGNHSLQWAADDLPAGNYWCVVHTNGQTERIGLSLVR